MHRRPTATAGALLVVVLALVGGDRRVAEGAEGSFLPATQQRARFEARVSRVRVNVIVTDDDGNFVDDLTAEDFRIYEDGVPQEVLEAQLIDLEAGVVTTVRTSIAGGADTSAIAADVADDPSVPARRGEVGDETPAATADMNPAERYGGVIFFIDFTGLTHVVKMHFTNQWGNYLETRVSTSVPQAVYLVDQVGILKEVVPLTTDMDRLRAAQRTVDGTPLTRTYFTATNEAERRLLGYSEYNRSHYTLRLLRQFCDALAARPGRTALVWVSSGVTLRGTFQDRGYEPNSTLLRLQKELHEAANSANVSIYGVDPSRYIDLLGGDPSATRAGSSQDELGNTLRAVSAATGGKHFVAWADFGAVVDNIEHDSSRYYLLTYAGPDNGDDVYHEIRVEVDRPGIEVRSKQGYVAYSEEERRSRFVSAALTLPGTVADLPVEAQVFRSAADGGKTDAIVAVTVSGAPLGMQTDEDGELMQRVEVHGVLLDTDNDMEIVAEMHRQVTEHLEEDGAPMDWLLSQQEWELEPGRYDLRIMVLDDSTGGVGSAQLDLEILETGDDEWRAGDVTFYESTGDGEDPLLAVQGRVRQGRSVAAIVELRGAEEPVAFGSVRPADLDSDLFAGLVVDPGTTPATSLFTQPLSRRRGVHSTSLRIPLLEPGDYIVEITIEDVPAQREHIVEVPLRVVDDG